MRHQACDRRVHSSDPVAHRDRDRPVGGVAFAPRPQLDQLHRLTRIEVKHEADAVPEAQRVGRLGVEPRVRQPPPLGGRDCERLGVGLVLPGEAEFVRNARTEVGGQCLPLHCQHPMALEVAERAVIGDDLEPVSQRLKSSPGSVAPVAAIATQVGEEFGTLRGVECGDSVPD